MIVLFLGDVVGRPGRELVRDELPGLRKRLGADLVIANGENASGGIGLTARNAVQLLDAGIDVLTSGNHIWKHRDIHAFFATEPRLLRPHNFPPGVPGTGVGVYQAANGTRVAVANLMGRTFMEPVDCPFQAADRLLAELPDEVRIRIVDVHAEATSEKKALAYHLRGRVTAVLGTHTHVQTSDAQVLDPGTAYVTDLGMCGVTDSILGMDPDVVLGRFLNRLPARFILAQGEPELQGAVLEIDEATGKARAIRLLRLGGRNPTETNGTNA